MSIASIFSQSVFYLLILLILSFIEQKCESLMKSSLSIIIIFISKSLFYPRSCKFSPVLFSSFCFVCFIFRSMINFELLFVEDIRSVSKFVSFARGCSLFQHHLLKKQSLLHCVAYVHSSETSWLYFCGSVSGFFILFHWSIYTYLSSILPKSYCPDDCSFILSLKIR